MDISKLINRAEKKIDITRFSQRGIFSKKEYITIGLFPIESRAAIKTAQTKGLDVDVLKNYILENNLAMDAANGKLDHRKILSDNPELMAAYIKPDFDPEFIEYKKLVLQNGLQRENHTLTDKGAPVTIDNDFIDNLMAYNKPLCDFLVKQIEKYNEEMTLKK